MNNLKQLIKDFRELRGRAIQGKWVEAETEGGIKTENQVLIARTPYIIKLSQYDHLSSNT